MQRALMTCCAAALLLCQGSGWRFALMQGQCQGMTGICYDVMTGIVKTVVCCTCLERLKALPQVVSLQPVDGLAGPLHYCRNNSSNSGSTKFCYTCMYCVDNQGASRQNMPGWHLSNVSGVDPPALQHHHIISQVSSTEDAALVTDVKHHIDPSGPK